MHLSLYSEAALTAFGALLALVTVVVACLGLFSNSHTSGRNLTKSGWIMASSIVMLGAGTFFMNELAKGVSAAKEREVSKARAAEFDDQMSSLRRLQAGMEASLSQQERTISVASEGVALTAETLRQTERSSRDILADIFESSNRITPDRVALSVSYVCPIGAPNSEYPTLEAVQIAIEERGETVLSLASRVSTRVNDVVVFHDFLADLGRYENFDAWRDAPVRVRVSGKPPSGPIPIGQIEAHLAFRNQLHDRGLEFFPMRCPMTVRLYINGRQVLKASGAMDRTSEAFYLAEYSDLRLDPSAIPSFSE